MFDALETRLRRLEDRTEIGELVTRYCLTMDNRDVAAIPGLFTADAVVRSLDGVMNATGPGRDRANVQRSLHRARSQ